MKEEPEEVNNDKYQAYDLYPDRRTAKESTHLYTLKETKKVFEKQKCVKNIVKACEENPLVKILMGALKKAGCPVSIKRNFCCENCDSSITGGYDPEFNQIVVCQNSFKARENPDVVLVHELVHMFDYCKNKTDFNNLEHLACSEIRAANLAHCSFISSFLLGQSSPINIKKTHQYCVKMKAAQSLILARQIDFGTALDVILKVFDKCYNDMEPVGRRIRRNSASAALAYEEAKLYNYCS